MIEAHVTLKGAWYEDGEDGVDADLSVEEGAGEEGVWYIHIKGPGGDMVSANAEEVYHGIADLLTNEILR